MAEARRRENPPWTTLPIDVLFNILIRLPVKCLLCLKSVCKSWNSLITSREFANHHFRRNSLSYDNLLIFAGKDDCLYSVNLATPESRARKIPFPSFSERLSGKSIAGSCNGLLLCLCDENPNFEALLLNSSSLPCKQIPKLEIAKNCLHVNYGLGYDFGADDYKIVRIVHFIPSTFGMAMEVMVYSSRADSWKLGKKKIPFYGSPKFHGGVLLNNNLLHWLFWSYSPEQYRIACFDVSTEEWQDVPMLDFETLVDIEYIESTEASDFYGSRYDSVVMGVLNGCLSFLITCYRADYVGLNVWIMKEYGVKDSWVKLFDFTDLCVIGSLCMVPITYSQDGTEILLRRDQLSRAFWYKLSEKTVKGDASLGMPGYWHVTTGIRTLIPPYDNGSC